MTLAEYGDFERPFCGRATGVVRELRERSGEELRYVFRHLPLSDVHGHAELAAEASEAAAAQGRFWEMHDALFAHQGELEVEDLMGYAADLGLDVERFGLLDGTSGRRRLRLGRHARFFLETHDRRCGKLGEALATIESNAVAGHLVALDRQPEAAGQDGKLRRRQRCGPSIRQPWPKRPAKRTRKPPCCCPRCNDCTSRTRCSACAVSGSA